MSIINPGNKKAILSCDGGGIRGIIITRCLERIEELEGKPCNQIFDLMTGTSTGAIIVGALAVGVPAKEISQLYLEHAKEIFKREINPFNLVKWKYSKKGIKRILAEIIKDVRIKDVSNDILITARDTVRGETIFFEKKMFSSMLLREAVESSMSAPTYFCPNGRYIDGGVGSFNNTCYQATVEAFHYLKYPRGNTLLLSFGTGSEITNMRDDEAEKKNLLQWATYAIGEGMEDANDQQVRLVLREYAQKGDIEFRRYQIKFSQDVFSTIGVPLSEIQKVNNFQMDNIKHLNVLDQIGTKFAQHIDFSKPEGLELGSKSELKKYAG